MKETELELNCKKLAEAMGWVGYKGFGRVGAPDKIFLKHGAGWTAEIKKPDGEGIQSKAQKVEEEYLRNRHVPYYLIESLEEFKVAILKEEEKLNRRMNIC